MSYIPRHIPFEKKLKLIWERIRDQLHKPYRIALMDFETFSESRQYVFKPLTLLLAGLLAVLIMVGGTASIIIFTPLREYIPGYFRPEYTQDISVLQAELDELKKAVQNQEAVMPALQPLSDKDAQPQAQEAISAVQSVAAPQQEAQAQQAAPQAPKPAATVMFNALKSMSSNALLTLYPPVRGTQSRSFSPAMSHYGTDLVAPENTLIQAATDGVVVFSDFSDRDGYIIAIAAANNVVTFYKHNSRLLKSVGSYVQAGEPIAIIGNSGENTTGPHLHFELWVGGKPVDPSAYLH